MLLVLVQGQSVSHPLLLHRVFVLYVQVKAELFVCVSQGRRFRYPLGIHYFVGVVFVILILFHTLSQK